jgi:tRNA1Val (adenine37-N6)-methyltransferase
MPTPDETVDRIFGGRVSVIQRRGGYRLSLDTLLLTAFVLPRAGEKVIDLGSGSGVVPLALATFYPGVECVGLEFQQPMLERARRGLRLNRVQDRVSFLSGNVRDVPRTFGAAGFDVVTSNPPYRRLSSGRPNPDTERYVARHEIEASINDFVGAAAHLLGRRGRMCIVYPAGRTVELWSVMSRSRIEPHRVRFVQSFGDANATLVLVEGVKEGRSDLLVLPPLVIYRAADVYTEEMQAVFDGTVFGTRATGNRQ